MSRSSRQSRTLPQIGLRIHYDGREMVWFRPTDSGDPMAERQELLGLTSDIVSAHLSNNAVAVERLPALIQQVFETLAGVQQATIAPPRPEPAVPVKKSVLADHIVCLDCGKHFSMLKRHIMTDHQFTPEQYRRRWELSATYPLVTPNYAKVRSALAKKIGLGRKGSTSMKAAPKATDRGRPKARTVKR